MKQVSPFDLLHSVKQDDYSKFGLDVDVKDGSRNPSRVILVKTNATIPDFTKEKFVLRMKLDSGDLLFKYIWLKAEFRTSNPSVAPVLDGYRIRLGK